jgi:hypothetical protein
MIGVIAVSIGSQLGKDFRKNVLKKDGAFIPPAESRSYAPKRQAEAASDAPDPTDVLKNALNSANAAARQIK